ncbi:hypothetical protein L3i20_v234030 [Paenibacillus sp. L3-i20]|nr:hypothetical protein L3i20_v234030 [Paenibacillus sp. L3-i20]
MITSQEKSDAHSFSSVEKKTTLMPNEELVFGDLLEFKVNNDKTIVFGLMQYIYENETYSLPLQLEL